MSSPRRSTSVTRRDIVSRRLTVAMIAAAAAVSAVVTALTLAPASAEELVDGVQLPTLPDSLAETGFTLADLVTAPLIAAVVIVLAGSALIIAATRRRSTD